MKWKIRVDTHRCRSLLKGSSRYIIGFEGDGEALKDHSHLYVETTVGRQGIIKRITKLQGYQKNCGWYSCKEMKESADDPAIKYFAYVVKDKNYETEGFNKEELKEIVEYDAKVKVEMKKKKKNTTVLKQIIQIIEDRIAEKSDTHDLALPCKSNIVDIVLDYYKERECLVREFQIVALCQTLCLKYVPDYTNEFRRKILGKVNKSNFD